MNIIIENGRKLDKFQKFKDKIKDVNPPGASQNKSGADFFVTKPQTLNQMFQAEDAIDQLPQEAKHQLLDDLNSLFDENSSHGDNDLLIPPEEDAKRMNEDRELMQEG